MNAMFFQQVRLTHACHHWPWQISTKLKTSKVTQTELKQNKRTGINENSKRSVGTQQGKSKAWICMEETIKEGAKTSLNS